MVHIIWRGKGWVVFVVTFVSSLVAELITRSITHDENYYSNDPYPFSISLLVSAAIVFFINKNLEAETYNVNLSERENNKRNNSIRHSLFFIPVKFWPLILFILAAANLALHTK
jgi:hypothetical protein